MQGAIQLANEYTPLPPMEERIGYYNKQTDERLLSNEMGVKTWHSFNEDTNETTLRYSQDINSILEKNKSFQCDHDGYSPSRELQFVASIPLVVVMKWLAEDGIDVWNKNHWPAVKRKLNDPEYRYLRTGLGRI